MNEDETRYLTVLGDGILVAAHMAQGNTAEEIYAALCHGTADDYITVGQMAGLGQDETATAVERLLADGYVTGEKDRPGVSLTGQGAAWYLRHALGMEPPDTP